MAVQDPNIAVVVGGDVTSLQRGMNEGAASVKQFASKSARQLRNTANHLVKVGAAATAAGAAIVTAIYAKQSKVIDSLAKTADALDITTERLQALNHLAELNGVTSEDMAKGLRRLETRLGEAARRGGTTAEAFRDIGVDIRQLLNLRPDQQLQVVSDALASIENQSLRASIATDLFGREGIRMLKVTKQIARDGIEPTVDELEALGVAISRVDAAQVEAANDAFFRARQVVSGLGKTLTVELAPYVEEVANQFISLAKESGGFSSHVQRAVEVTIRGFAKAADVIQGLRVVFKGVELVAVAAAGAVVTSWEIAVKGVAKFIDFMMGGVNRVIDGLNKLPKVDIANIDPFSDSAFVKGLENLGNNSREQVVQLRQELHDLAMQPLPSDQVEGFLANVRARAEEAAMAVANVAPQANDEGGGFDEPTSDEEKANEEHQRALERLKDRYLTEQELLAEHRETMALIGEEWDASKFETEEQWRQIRLQAEADFYQQLHDLANRGYSGIQALISTKWGAIGAATAGAIQSIVGTMATGSKKAFEISKAWALADALISTYQGIAAGVRLGWPMGIPAVAWATATGFAQVQQIRNQKFGGAGGAAASGQGTPGTAPNPVGVGGSTTGPGGAQQGALITVSGFGLTDLISGRQLVDIINEAQANGANIRTDVAG